MYNGTPAQVGSFRAQTGATYPLGLRGADTVGGNLGTLYGPYDNYIVVDRRGIVRYHAADRWPQGNRYRLNELRTVVDSLLADRTGVQETPSPPPPLLWLSNQPNPFSSSTLIQLTHGGTAAYPARVEILDLLGRRVSTIYEGILAPGLTTLSWNGRTEVGEAAAGFYLVRAALGDRIVTHRLVKVK